MTKETESGPELVRAYVRSGKKFWHKTPDGTRVCVTREDGEIRVTRNALAKFGNILIAASEIEVEKAAEKARRDAQAKAAAAEGDSKPAANSKSEK